jgi:hypothetical protein
MMKQMTVIMFVMVLVFGPVSSLTAYAQGMPEDQGVEQSIPGPFRAAFIKVNNFFDALFTKITGQHAEEDPTARGIAPFADSEAVIPLTDEQQAKNALARPETTLDQPHRNERDLENWLVDAMADLLSFDANNYTLYVTEILPRGMSQSGIEELNEWVVGNGVLESLRANNLRLNAFATGRPVLLNEGVLSGRYRWLYEIPVLLSFLPVGIIAYDEKLASNSQKILITVQIGRVQDSVLEHNVMIETWSVRVPPPVAR